MVSRARTASATWAAAPRPVLRPARIEDCRWIAELFRISSDGIADDIWSTLQDDYPGQALLEIGARRYARDLLRREGGARRLYERHGFTVVERRAVVPHPMIHATGEALLMSAPVD